jgi:hypothetical protein
MNVIPTRTHAILDDVMAAVLILTPFVFLFEHAEAAKWTLIYAGIVTFVASLLTHDDLGVAWAIPMPGHLALDVLIGAVLIASPWVLGFSNAIWWPHVILGAVKILIALATSWRVGAGHGTPMGPRHQAVGMR